MGDFERVASEAAGSAQVMGDHLVTAMVSLNERRVRVDAATAAFRVWPLLCRQMAALAELAPFSAEDGQRRADRVREIAEAHNQLKRGEDGQ